MNIIVRNEPTPLPEIGLPPGGRTRRRWGRLAAFAAFATFCLIVFGGIVRITGSGMGCGDDWPLCNGRLIPALDFATWIEYGHRLFAAGVSLLVFGLVLFAWWPRRRSVWRTARRLSALALVLLVVQVMLGAVTVWLELPPTTVILHLTTAFSLFIVLILSAAWGLASQARVDRAPDRAARWTMGLAAYTLIVAVMGGLVANLEAGPACLGFPACNGSWLPGGGALVHVHWTHRVLAYLLVVLLLAWPFLVRRWRAGDTPAIATAAGGALVGLAQVAVAAAMVWDLFPAGLRAAHLAVGTALVAVMAVLAWIVERPRSVGAFEKGYVAQPAGGADADDRARAGPPLAEFPYRL